MEQLENKYPIGTTVKLAIDCYDVEPRKVAGYKNICGFDYLIFTDGYMAYVGRVKQYCSCCGYMVVGDVNYCSKDGKRISDASAKLPNCCDDFAYNPIDAFGENEKGYQPRIPKKTQCDGQMSLF